MIENAKRKCTSIVSSNLKSPPEEISAPPTEQTSVSTVSSDLKSPPREMSAHLSEQSVK